MQVTCSLSRCSFTMRLRGRLAGWTQTPPRPASKATSPTKPYWNDSPPYLMEIHFSKESKMDDNDFSDWKLCWQVNLLFHEPVTNIQKCIVCSGVHDYTNYARRSTFWLDITRCTTGHRQATQVEVQGTPSLGVCAICDQMYLFDIVNGKYKCRREGCRRIVRVHEGELRQRLAHDNVLLKYVCVWDLAMRSCQLLIKSQQLSLYFAETQIL